MKETQTLLTNTDLILPGFAVDRLILYLVEISRVFATHRALEPQFPQPTKWKD